MENRKKLALVTGASQGLGACIAHRLAAIGFKVIVNYAHSDVRAEAVAADIRAKNGDAIAMKCDISDEVAVVALFAKVEKEFGGVDVLVNNA